MVGSSECKQPTNYFEQLYQLVDVGISPTKALQMATSQAARMLNLHEELGKIYPGYRADLIIIDGQPDLVIRDLEQVKQVVIDGALQNFDEPGFLEVISLWFKVFWTDISQ